MKPCGHDGDNDQCRVCRVARANPRYAARWSRPSPPAGLAQRTPRGGVRQGTGVERPAPPQPCIHLGPALPGEAGTCELRLRRCDEYGVCSLRPTPRSSHHCLTMAGTPLCPSYESRE